MTECIIPFKPNDPQLTISKEMDRFSVLVLHRRAGKTTFAINWLIKEALTCHLRMPRVAYIAPYRSQAKVIAWNTMVKYYALNIPGIKFNESELTVSFPNGAMLYVLGADSPDSVRGAYWDAIVIDEYAQIKENLWGEVIRPALADRKGKAVFIGTPMGRNAFYKLYQKAKTLKGWYTKIYTVDDTDILDPEELKAIENEIGIERYSQEFLCSWSAAIQGAFYGDVIAKLEKQGRITDVPYDSKYTVQTAWDIGLGDATAIWFYQTMPTGAINIIDLEWDNGKSLEYWIDVVKDKPYKYSKHIGPHDLEVREYSTGLTRRKMAYDKGIDFTVASKLKVSDGINAVRSILPLCYFDEKNCRSGFEALKYYRKDYNKRLNVFNDVPLHDENSDPADAFRYLAVMYDEYKPLGYNRGKSLTVKHRK